MSEVRISAARILLEELRRIGASECRALDAATEGLTDREKVLLSAHSRGSPLISRLASVVRSVCLLRMSRRARVQGVWI